MNNIKLKVMFAVLIISTVMGSSAFINNNFDKNKIAVIENNAGKFAKINTEKDSEFLVKASELIIEEINLAKLAQVKGRMSHVKELGKKMEVDHTKSLTDLKILAKSKNISLPTSQTEDAEENYKDLNDKSGNDFDKAYIDRMVNTHEDAIKLFEKASTDSDDNDIKLWALFTLQTLRLHHDHSVVCQKELDKM